MTDAAGIDMRGRTIWISWERHRRTLELSRALGVELFDLEDRHSGIIRYVRSGWRTLRILHRRRPRQLLVQNPSIVLALLAACLKPVFAYRLVVDRHTNFDNFHLWEADARRKLLGLPLLRLTRRLFLLVSDFTIRHSNLTIVTNAALKGVVESKGGRGVVLPDKLPDIPAPAERGENLSRIVTCVSTYAHDEPYMEVIEAARRLDPAIRVHFTGNHRQLPRAILASCPANVVFTGFLSERDYIDLLRKSDVIIALTKVEHCLVCGGYEAVAAERPLITSDTTVLRDYFTTGVQHVANEADAVRLAVERIYADYAGHRSGILKLKRSLQRSWPLRFDGLRRALFRPSPRVPILFH